MHQLEVDLNLAVKDDKNVLKDGAASKVFALNLDNIADRLKIPADALAQEVQNEINALDATDSVPGDGMYEAGLAKHFKVNINLFITHLRDGVDASAGAVAKVTNTAVV